MRASNKADEEGDWSEPDEISVEDIPPPSNIDAQVHGVLPSVDEGVVSFSLVMTVSWEGSGPSQTGQRKKRQAALMPNMELTQYTVVVGTEEIEGPYDPIPTSSIQRDINVSFVRIDSLIFRLHL